MGDMPVGSVKELSWHLHESSQVLSFQVAACMIMLKYVAIDHELMNVIITPVIIAQIGGIIGSYIGTKLAINKGERFAKYALAPGAGVSGIALLS